MIKESRESKEKVGKVWMGIKIKTVGEGKEE